MDAFIQLRLNLSQNFNSKKVKWFGLIQRKKNISTGLGCDRTYNCKGASAQYSCRSRPSFDKYRRHYYQKTTNEHSYP